ncbi:MAG: hypothetical protein ACR2Q3_08920 [Woeseiaceae bacterium]
MEFKRNSILGLAIASVLCTNVALADDDETTIVATAPAAVSTEVTSRDGAKAANREAAEEAVQAVLADNRLDLDIRLIGPTSVKIASDR